MSAKDMIVEVLAQYQIFKLAKGNDKTTLVEPMKVTQQILDRLPKEDEIMETVKSVKVEDYSNWSSYYRALAKAISMMIKEGQ